MWSITERFPTWGEEGEFPIDGFFYEGGDQVNEKHLDALWNGLKEFENETRAALEDIDSDSDGIVDEADYANDADASTYKGNDIDTDGDGKVNAAADADTVGGEPPSEFADSNHGNEEHSSNFTTLTEVNNNADVPNADFADTAGDADTLDGRDFSDLKTPSGLITMWSGNISNIPSGWTLCDGSDGAPDLRNRFIVGAGGAYSTDATGGTDEVKLTEQELPSHNHSITHTDITNINGLIGGVATDDRSLSNKSNLINDTGGDEPHENRPPYYALAFIMKV